MLRSKFKNLQVGVRHDMDNIKKEMQETKKSVTSLENSIKELKALIMGMNVAMVRANSTTSQGDNGVQNSEILSLPKEIVPQQGKDNG